MKKAIKFKDPGTKQEDEQSPATETAADTQESGGEGGEGEE